MKKNIFILAVLFFVTSAGVTFAAGAASSVFRDTAGFIRPLILTDFIKATYFTATSTTQASTFPYASTTNTSAVTFCLTGDSCRTTWPASGVASTSFTATYPVQVSTSPLINYSLAFGTTTANTWALLQTFSNASTSLLTVSGTQWLTGLATGAGAFLAVDNNGKVIATTSPTTGGGVVGAGTTGQNAYYSALNTVTGTSSLFTATSGFIGIGTTTPISPLSVLTASPGTYGTIAAVTSQVTNARTFSALAPSLNTAARALAIFGTDPSTNNAGTLGFTNAGGSGSASNYMELHVFGGTDNALVITPAGNVGIGTTTPAQSLVVNGVLRVLGTANGNFRSDRTVNGVTGATNMNSFDDGNSLFTRMNFQASELHFFTNASANTERMVIDTSGNIGIGSTTPGSLLSLGSLANFTTATSTFYSTGGINLTSGCFAIGNTCLVTGSGALGAGTTGQVAYYNGTNTAIGTSSVFITPSGAVGVGTISPSDVSARLAVAGTGFLDVAASTTDITTTSRAGFDAFADAAQIGVRANGSLLPNVRYGLTLGGWSEITAFGGTVAATNGMVIGTAPAKPLVFGTNSAERMRIDSSGLVGIGTTTPHRLLDVWSSTTSVPSLTAYTGVLGVKTGSTVELSMGALTDSPFTFWMQTRQDTNAGTSWPLALNPLGGNVGIGTTNPPNRLSVADTNIAATVADSGNIYAYTTNSQAINLGAELALGGSYTGTTRWEFGSVAGRKENGTDNNAAGYLQFNTYANGAGVMAERMRITSAGLVGIGSTAPNQGLTVQGSGTTSPNITTATALGSTIAVNDTGTGAGNGGTVMFGAASGSWTFAAIKGNVTDGSNNSAGDLLFSTRNLTTDNNLTERMRILANGNVGIGLTAPGNLLDVGGNMSLTSSTQFSTISIRNNSNTAIALQSQAAGNDNGALLLLNAGVTKVFLPASGTGYINGGNLGIGTTTPVSKLTVNGDIGTDGTNVTVTGCGTSPTVTTGSTDTAGEVTQGSIATGCTISFSTTKAAAPFCVVDSEAGLGFTFTESTTAITIVNVGALSSTKLTYICVQNNK